MDTYKKQKKELPWYRMILPKLMSVVTRHPRYLPSFEWSRDLLTHDVFRIYEWLFFRKQSIRREAAVSVYLDEEMNRRVKFVFFTFESRIAHIEGLIRSYLKLRYSILKALVLSFIDAIDFYFDNTFSPDYVTINSVPIPKKNGNVLPIQLLAAIAYGSANTAYAVGITSQTANLTISGSYTILIANAGHDGATQTMDYNGTSMSAIGSGVNGGGARTSNMFALTAPTTGTHAVTVNFGSSTNGGFSAAYYTGVNQSGQPTNNSSVSGASGSSVTATTTVPSDDSWLIAVERDDFGSPTAGSGTRLIAGLNFSLLDSNGTVAAGSRSLAWTYGASSTYGYTIAVMAPFIPTLTDGLRAYYKLDESSGNASDSSGNGYTLTNTGSMTYGTGKINNGASTDGTGGKYLVNTNILGRTQGGNGDITIAGWFNWSVIGAGGSAIVIGDGNTSPYIGFGIGVETSRIRFNRLRMCTANTYTDDTFTVNTGQWYFIALRWDGTTITGNVDARTAVTGTPTGDGVSCGGEGTFIGDNTGNNPVGVIDEVGFWDRKLTDAEIATLYNSGSGSQYPFNGLSISNQGPFVYSVRLI